MFIDEIKKISAEHENVKIFVDMDGTIAEYPVYDSSEAITKMTEDYINTKPLKYVIDVLKDVSEIPNVSFYVLSFSSNMKITEQKEKWLKKHTPFIPQENYIILTKENGDYSSENRPYIKGSNMIKRYEENGYLVFVDDEHQVLREAKKMLSSKGCVFHISSVLAV